MKWLRGYARFFLHQQIQHVRCSGFGVRSTEGRGPRFRGPVLPVGVPPQANLHPEPGLSRPGARSRRQAERAEREIPAAHGERVERLRQSGDRDGADAGERAGVRCGLQVRQDVRLAAGTRPVSWIDAG